MKLHKLEAFVAFRVNLGLLLKTNRNCFLHKGSCFLLNPPFVKLNLDFFPRSLRTKVQAHMAVELKLNKKKLIFLAESKERH